MNLSQLLPSQFQLVNHHIKQATIQIGLVATPTTGKCPTCQMTARKVYSFYQRTMADLPICGKAVSLQVHLRKFFCGNPECPRKIFAQTSSDDFRPYARRLHRAEQPLLTIALQTGARPAAKLCALTGQPVSHSTLLRISRKMPVAQPLTPKRLGVDDFAFRKGRRYGTLLIDLDRHQPIDVLPDREGKTLEDWLRNHPGIELVTRDRSSVYASAITTAAPEAVQVADRWHLLANLSEVVERFLDTQREAINESILVTLPPVEPAAPAPPITEKELPQSLTWNHDLSKLMTTSSKEGTSKRQVAYEQVKKLQGEGHSMRSIARHLGLAASAVRSKYGQTLREPGQVCGSSEGQAVESVTIRGIFTPAVVGRPDQCERAI